MNRESPRLPPLGSETGATAVGRLRPSGRVPSVVSVALVAALVGLIVGFGLGYRVGAVAPTPTPGPTPTPLPSYLQASSDLQVDGVSSRLALAYDSAAPGGWAVCSLGREVVCHPLVASITEPRVPPSEYALGWYGRLDLTSVTVSQAHLVLAASLNEGLASAWLHNVGPGDVFRWTEALTTVNPGRQGAFYFDLGTLGPGHYAIEVDFLALPQAGESARMVQTYLAGFVVG